MVLNVQITMTNVLGWSCLIHDFSIHSEKEASNKLKETTFCDLQQKYRPLVTGAWDYGR